MYVCMYVYLYVFVCVARDRVIELWWLHTTPHLPQADVDGKRGEKKPLWSLPQGPGLSTGKSAADR